VSVHDYLRRLRLADVMRLVADGDHNVRSGLYASGWRSPKSLYAAAVAVAGLPFDQLCALPREEWERRLACHCARTDIGVPAAGAVSRERSELSQIALPSAVA
jgi:hypothetical protein